MPDSASRRGAGAWLPVGWHPSVGPRKVLEVSTSTSCKTIKKERPPFFQAPRGGCYTCIMAAPDDDPLVFVGHLITSACRLKADVTNGFYDWHVPPVPGTALRLRRGGEEVSKLHFFLPGGGYVGQLVYELWYMKSYLGSDTVAASVAFDVVISGSPFYVQTEMGPAPRLPLNVQVYASVGKAAEVSARLARVAAPYTAFVPAPRAGSVVLLNA